MDEAAQSMTFACDIPEGSDARLMKANFERLVDCASGAARSIHAAVVGGSAELELLISVEDAAGRRLLEDRAELAHSRRADRAGDEP